jgi:hypothetical protein
MARPKSKSSSITQALVNTITSAGLFGLNDAIIGCLGIMFQLDHYGI